MIKMYKNLNIITSFADLYNFHRSGRGIFLSARRKIEEIYTRFAHKSGFLPTSHLKLFALDKLKEKRRRIDRLSFLRWFLSLFSRQGARRLAARADFDFVRLNERIIFGL